MEIEKIFQRYILGLLVHFPLVAMYFGFGFFEISNHVMRFTSLITINLSLWTTSFLMAFVFYKTDTNLLFDEYCQTILGGYIFCSMIVLVSWIFVPSSLAIYSVNMLSCPIVGLISFGMGSLMALE